MLAHLAGPSFPTCCIRMLPIRQRSWFFETESFKQGGIGPLYAITCSNSSSRRRNAAWLRRNVAFILSVWICNTFHSMYYFSFKTVLGRENLIEDKCHLKMGTNMNIKKIHLKCKTITLSTSETSLPTSTRFLIFKIQNISVFKLPSKPVQTLKSCQIFHSLYLSLLHSVSPSQIDGVGH